MKKAFGLFAVCCVLLYSACNEDSSDSGGSGSSHNAGKNCIGCHSFKLAGSVYNSALTSSYSGAIMKISTGANGGGTVLATLTSDKSGNFYTNSTINFGTGVYVSITGTGGTVKYMESAITSGACNSCHNGSATSKIWAE